jgi:protein O-mannosyl-transferase
MRDGRLEGSCVLGPGDRSAPAAAMKSLRASGRRGVAAALLVVGVILAVHHRVYTIPFMYSEIVGIQRNKVVNDLGLFAERMLTPRGLLQRPLSVLSYALDHAAYGGSIAGYHVTNVAIHCVNAVLVLALAARFFSAPLVAGLVFAVHPLGTACVSQIFGRNYSLATTFFLIAVFCYLLWRCDGAPTKLRPLRLMQVAALAGLVAATVLTKQSLVILPVVLAWCELGLRARRAQASLSGVAAATPAVAAVDLPNAASTRASGDEARARRWAAALTIGAAVTSIALGAVLLVLYALPLSRTAAIPPAQFFWSQLGNALTTASFFLLPYRTALIHGLPVYRSPMHPDVLVGAVFASALAVFAWRRRMHPEGWLVGAMLICMVPANSVLPKNEIVREWRLYPSLVFFALLVADVWSTLVARAHRRGRVLSVTAYAALTLYLAAFARSDLRQNVVYQSGISAWRHVLERYPGWADAANNLGFYHYYAGDYRASRHYFAQAVRAAPDVYLYRRNLARAYAALGNVQRARRHNARAAEIRKRYGGRVMAFEYR